LNAGEKEGKQLPRQEQTGSLVEIGLIVAALTVPLWAMTPLDIFDRFGLVKFQVIMLVATGILVAVAVRGLAEGTFSIPSSPVLVLLGMLVLQSVFAALFSRNPATGVWGNDLRYDGLFMILANCALFLVAYRLATTDGVRTARLVAAATGLASLPIGVYAVIQSAGLDPVAWEPFRVGWHRAFSTLGNPIFLGAFAAFAAMVCLGLAASASGRARVWWTGMTGLNVAAVVLSGTRASWVALGASGVLFAVLCARKRTLRPLSGMLFLVAVVSAVLVVGSLWYGGRNRVPTLAQSASTLVTPGAPRNEGRIETWRITLRIIRDHPVFGVGPDELGQVFPSYRTVAFERAEGAGVVADKPHSSLLQWAVETGLPGAVLFVSVCLVIFAGTARRVSGKEGGGPAEVLLGAVWIAALAYLGQSLITVTAIGVDGVWWISLGLLAGVGAVDRRGLATERQSRLTPKPGRDIARSSYPQAMGQAGFTLIELLVVIIIIAILAAIAIPTYLGQRDRAMDAAAVTLVRNALTVVEGAYIDTNSFSSITAPVLTAAEPSIAWNIASSPLVDPSVPTVTSAVVAHAARHEVDVYEQSDTVFDVASLSGSGNRFGVRVQLTGQAGATYVKVKTIGGTSSSGW
jgi:type IV pilus assembly protein PilA